MKAWHTMLFTTRPAHSRALLWSFRLYFVIQTIEKEEMIYTRTNTERRTGEVESEWASVCFDTYAGLCMQDLSSNVQGLGAAWLHYLPNPDLYQIQL